ncbi:MAG TPA: hypothetical protein VG897_06140 [Terriglobales bacterium]|nr:hypothetical protein [Terriglobales bacterium]
MGAHCYWNDAAAAGAVLSMFPALLYLAVRIGETPRREKFVEKDHERRDGPEPEGFRIASISHVLVGVGANSPLSHAH